MFPASRSRILCWFLLLAIPLTPWAVGFPRLSAAEGQDSEADPKTPQSDSAGDLESTSLPAGHSVHGEAFNDGPRQAAYLMGGTGSVKFPVTTKSPLAQLFFDQGLGQLHGFWYWEAERSFRQAAALDPDCAMAYWGMAMANTNNSQRAVNFIREAVERRQGVTPRESLYIDSLSDYYEDWDQSRKNSAAAAKQEQTAPAADEPSADRAKGRTRRAANDSQKAAEKKRKQDYLENLEAITRQFPDDVEAKAFLAYYRWNWRSTVPIDDRESVDALLKQVFEAEPMHPAHHYRIHLWDDPDPQRALGSAMLCGPAAPAIGHMWHMPGHIYSKLYRYHDAVYQQEASARVDHAYMMRDRVVPYRIHNYAHNNEWLARNLLHVGRVRDALDVARNLIEVPRHPKLNTPTNRASAAHFGRERLFDTLILYELWNDYIWLYPTVYFDPGDSDRDQIRRTRWLAAAHLSAGNQIQGGEQYAELADRLNQLQLEQDQAGEDAEAKARQQQKPDADADKARDDARRGFDNRVKVLEKALAHLDGLRAAAARDYETAAALFEQAGDLPKPHLARTYLYAGDDEKAETLAREAVDADKNQVYPLATYVEILYELEKDDEARQAFEELRRLARSSDLKAPIFDRLARVAADFGYPRDWRLPAEQPAATRLRPPLDSLGPFRWQPTPAARWRLLNTDGEVVSLHNYYGKPVVVIFYLGYGCLHCAQQLQAFAPLTKDFQQAGIQLVAVSTDSVDELKKSIEGSGFGVQGSGESDATQTAVGFPIPLVSNSDLRVFKAYRCFDDFEQQPLHGTFLLDRDGLVRWQEIGPEPFTDAAFLLQEAKRLIALPR